MCTFTYIWLHAHVQAIPIKNTHITHTHHTHTHTHTHTWLHAHAQAIPIKNTHSHTWPSTLGEKRAYWYQKVSFKDQFWSQGVKDCGGEWMRGDLQVIRPKIYMYNHSSVKPVLNWANVFFAEHTLGSLTNYNLFLNWTFTSLNIGSDSSTNYALFLTSL